MIRGVASGVRVTLPELHTKGKQLSNGVTSFDVKWYIHVTLVITTDQNNLMRT